MDADSLSQRHCDSEIHFTRVSTSTERARSAPRSSTGGRGEAGHSKPYGTWEVMIKDHHESLYQLGRVRAQSETARPQRYGRAGGLKTGRGGRASSLRHHDLWETRPAPKRSLHGQSAKPTGISLRDSPNLMMGLPRCMTFGGPQLIPRSRGSCSGRGANGDRSRIQSQLDASGSTGRTTAILDLELRQARYEASLAERQYAHAIRTIVLSPHSWRRIGRPRSASRFGGEADRRRKASRDRS